ncbi:MAG: YfhO family protein [Clostridia bacterium]|nr:YfhO family protein [Clostridia bacterium]
MAERSKKLNNRKDNKGMLLSTFLIALLTAACLFVPYILDGRGYFIFYGDFNVQQIPFYKMCHAAIKSGAYKWSFTTDLGANFIGSYSFYLLGSPFFWLTIPFPNNFVPYLMGPLLILKFACAAATGYLYIRRFTVNAYSARLGGLLYAFSGFSVYNIFFNHFHEAIIVFPLLLLSIELNLTEHKRGLVALAVCLAAVTNYFFFFGMAVFCVIYYFVRLSTGITFRIKTFLSLAFEAILGVLMSAAMLLPAITAILGNERISHILLGWSGIVYGKEQIYLNIIECFFFPPDLPARPVFFPGAEVKWSSLGGWLPLFSMTGVITAFYGLKRSFVKRMIIISAFMALIPILNSAFYAFNGSYYARWFYMPILIMCLATVLVFERGIDTVRGFRWTAGITLAFALVIGLFPQKTNEEKIIFGLFTDSDSMEYIFRFWATVAISVGSLILLRVLMAIFLKNRKRFILVSTAAVCIVAAIYGNFFIALGRLHSYDINNGMINTLLEGKLNLDGDKDTYRIDTYKCVDNTAMYMGYSGINAFHSIVPPSIMEFYNYIGIKRDVGSRPGTDYPAIRPLLSVKYLLDRKDDEDNFAETTGESKMPGYKYIKDENNFAIYENQNYIGYGFSPDYYMTEEFLENYSGSQKTRLMLKAVLLTKKQAKKYSSLLGDLEEVATNEAEKAYLLASGQETETVTEQEGRENGINMSLTNEQMAIDAQRLNKTSATSFKTDKNGFTATVKREKESLVVFTVPYDEGFTAYINGKKAPIEKVDVGFMAVLVPKGESTIRFSYETPGLKKGIYITISSFTILLLYVIIMWVIDTKREKKLIGENTTEIVIEDYYKDKKEEDSSYFGLDNINNIYEEQNFEGGFDVDKGRFMDD